MIIILCVFFLLMIELRDSSIRGGKSKIIKMKWGSSSRRKLRFCVPRNKDPQAEAKNTDGFTE